MTDDNDFAQQVTNGIEYSSLLYLHTEKIDSCEQYIMAV